MTTPDRPIESDVSGIHIRTMRNFTVEHEFQERHIQIVWNELHSRFGFDLKSWKTRFKEHVDKQPRNVDEVGTFFRFGNDVINPLLNDLLGRRQGYPTFNKLCEYVIKKV